MSQSAVGIRPPETVFPMIALGDKDPYWDMRSDIWSLACTVSFFFGVSWNALTFELLGCLIEKIFEIITGGAFFYGVGGRGLIGRMARIFGEVPPHWAAYWASNEYLKDQGAPFYYCYLLL